MRTKAWLSGIFVTLALGLAPMGAALAQTTASKNVINFEVISIDGNKVVVRDQNGAREITVPADFKFTVDGKKLSVSELKPGMKGTATVTTTTTMTPVTVTEMRDADVVRASDVSVTIKQTNGEYRKFGQGELDKRGIQIVKDGKVVRTADLKRGDKLTATIVTAGPPVALTSKEVEATTVADATPAPAMAPAAPATAPAMAPARSSGARRRTRDGTCRHSSGRPGSGARRSCASPGGRYRDEPDLVGDHCDRYCVAGVLFRRKQSAGAISLPEGERPGENAPDATPTGVRRPSPAHPVRSQQC